MSEPTKSGLFVRLAEPSSWAGLSAMAIVVAGQIPDPYHGYALIVAGVAGALAVVLRERGTKTAEEIIADAIAAARNSTAGK